jgi:hypothetical protein
MYRCGKEAKMGDCVSIQVEIDTQQAIVPSGTIGLVLEINKGWSIKTPLLTIKLPNNNIHQFPSNWCTLCERK